MVRFGRSLRSLVNLQLLVTAKEMLGFFIQEEKHFITLRSKEQTRLFLAKPTIRLWAYATRMPVGTSAMMNFQVKNLPWMLRLICV